VRHLRAPLCCAIPSLPYCFSFHPPRPWFWDQFCWQLFSVEYFGCVDTCLVLCGFSEVTGNLVDGDEISWQEVSGVGH
jgi:hypothetical protein